MSPHNIMPTTSGLALEAVIVALGLVLIFYFVEKLSSAKTSTTTTLVNVAIAGAAFHLLCEYSGVNAWYVKNYVN